MKTKFLKHTLALAILGLASQASQAACTTVGSTGVVGFNLAVASNFYLSAQTIAASFLAQPNEPPKDYDIYICEGSSGNLYDTIVPSNAPQYALFLSADEERPARLPAAKSSPVQSVSRAPFPVPRIFTGRRLFAASRGWYRAPRRQGFAPGRTAPAPRSSGSGSCRPSLRRGP